MAFFSCASKKQVIHEVYKTDTLRVTKDTIIYKDRVVKVEVPVPVTNIKNVVPSDTMSILQSDIYKSKAWITEGLLHHTLETLPNASLSAPVVVHDTIMIHDSSEAINNMTQINTTDTVYVNKLTTMQKIYCNTGKFVLFVIFGAIAIFIARFFLKKYGILK